MGKRYILVEVDDHDIYDTSDSEHSIRRTLNTVGEWPERNVYRVADVTDLVAAEQTMYRWLRERLTST